MTAVIDRILDVAGTIGLWVLVVTTMWRNGGES